MKTTIVVPWPRGVDHRPRCALLEGETERRDDQVRSRRVIRNGPTPVEQANDACAIHQKHAALLRAVAFDGAVGMPCGNGARRLTSARGPTVAQAERTRPIAR